MLDVNFLVRTIADTLGPELLPQVEGRLHLFVQGRSHQPAFYLGEARFIEARGDAPMTVTFELDQPVPLDIQGEFVDAPPGDEPRGK